MTTATGGMLVYVGTYTQSLPHAGGKATGIEVFRLDLASGALTPVCTVDGLDNPSYLVLDPAQRFLYCVEEVDDGRVRAFRLDPASGTPVPINQQSSYGAAPAHIGVDRSGRFVLVANYVSGTAAVLPIRNDGGLDAATTVVQHTGKGPRADRQEGPHAHWIGADPGNRFVLVVDLGLDAVVRYRFDAAQGLLARTDDPACLVEPGAGPRHLAFRPDGRYAYVINELASTLAACAYDASSGDLRLIQTVSTVPDGWSGENTTAAVRVAPSGRFVYGSNRGHDSIAIFASDADTGRLTLVGHEPTQGQVPRDVNIDPTGTFLLAANQESGTIVTFRIDPDSGRLQATGHVTAASTPVCIDFGPRVSQ